MKMKISNLLSIPRENVKPLVLWVIVIMGLILLINLKSGNIGSKECPEKAEGNADANLKIKYFGNKFCVYCWVEQPIIDKAVKEKGNSFSIEYYDNRHCGNFKSYGFLGIPGFVFENKEGMQRFQGYMGEEDFNKIICDMGGGC